ncbi:helix-turn-helix domain-containing protein [Paenibacillus polymyxa]|uniref:helix-turn-helix domain-containing protein n=1 Tax=Paenibacillus TaxID=44249 RepID=UPI00105A949E|nr:XRE family transcriptional regulator [Paenibacillus amylolyticus]TDL68762.1 XRE family transcriptional regulator [Paenibacillus amylolyticus]UOK60741.1 XRE family transcriptional regulator [Paenibacillus sp. OVF10]
MKNINSILAQNLKQLREQRKLSLDKVAEMSGISKTMLGQIERGESNPSIATVWKIANGLKTSFTALIHEPKSDTTVVTGDDIQVLMEDEGRVRIYPHFPFEEGRRFEMYMMEMDVESSLSAESHIEGTEEFITVFEGEVTIRVGTEEYMVSSGESIRFRADKPHAYINPGASAIKLSMVIHYSK